jgi:hypothetical protein
MPPQESGTMRHVKGMAGATYLYESERGNQYPRLDISIDYRGPKNIRLRAYDEDHHVVDTLGANDLAEACLLAGLTIRSAETLHARKLRSGAEEGRTKRRRLPVAVRFLDALTLALRRQGAAGAAEAVVTAASLQFHPDNWRTEREPAQVLALSELALRRWAISGLRALGGEHEMMIATQLDGYLAQRAPFPAENAADAASLLVQVELPDRGRGPNPHMPKPVSKVLAEVADSLGFAAQAGTDPADAVALPGDPLNRSVEHAAMALAAAFNAGVVTELPSASGEVFALLARIA